MEESYLERIVKEMRNETYIVQLPLSPELFLTIIRDTVESTPQIDFHIETFDNYRYVPLSGNNDKERKVFKSDASEIRGPADAADTSIQQSFYDVLEAVAAKDTHLYEEFKSSLTEKLITIPLVHPLITFVHPLTTMLVEVIDKILSGRMSRYAMGDLNIIAMKSVSWAVLEIASRNYVRTFHTEGKMTDSLDTDVSNVAADFYSHISDKASAMSRLNQEILYLAANRYVLYGLECHVPDINQLKSQIFQKMYAVR